MIDKNEVRRLVEEAIAGTDAFVVDITVSAANDIVVELDSATGIDLDFCADLNRSLNEKLDREAEDYSLEVGTASLTAPFKVKGQYEKTSATKSKSSRATAASSKACSQPSPIRISPSK